MKYTVSRFFVVRQEVEAENHLAAIHQVDGTPIPEGEPYDIEAAGHCPDCTATLTDRTSQEIPDPDSPGSFSEEYTYCDTCDREIKFP